MSKAPFVDWGRLERQLAALGEAVADGARNSAEDAERARRSLDRLESLERLLGAEPPVSAEPAGPAAGDESAAGGVADTPVDSESGAPARAHRASLHHSPLADLFRDTQRGRRPD